MSREQSTLLQEGEKMKNESVKHVRYGTGRVAEVVQNHMVVLFDGEAGRKVFPYPDAFERFLCFDDPILQKRAEAAVMELKKKRTEEAKQRLVVYQLYEAKRRQEQTVLFGSDTGDVSIPLEQHSLPSANSKNRESRF